MSNFSQHENQIKLEEYSYVNNEEAAQTKQLRRDETVTSEEQT